MLRWGDEAGGAVADWKRDRSRGTNIDLAVAQRQLSETAVLCEFRLRLLPATNLPTDPALSCTTSLKILAISQPASSKYPPLPGTIEEMEKLRGRFLEAEVVHLGGPDATVDAVLNTMSKYQSPYIHIACHRMQTLDDPRNSAFELHVSPLQPGRFMSKSVGNAKLAFLSACQTATGDVKLTDESVHLAAGMLAVGYRGVIGTMWSICDDDAPPPVTDEFYHVLMERGR